MRTNVYNINTLNSSTGCVHNCAKQLTCGVHIYFITYYNSVFGFVGRVIFSYEVKEKVCKHAIAADPGGQRVFHEYNILNNDDDDNDNNNTYNIIY